MLCTSDECGEQGWHDPAKCRGIFADPDVSGADIYFMACRYGDLTGADAWLDAPNGMNGENEINAWLANDP